VNSHNETRDECLSEELISGYLEGSLAPFVKAACEMHLIGCDRCRENLATLMRLLRSDTDPEEEPDVSLALTQWDRRNPAPLPRRKPQPFWKRAGYIAGIAAILVLGVVFVLPLSDSTAEDLVQDLLQKNRPFDAQLASQPYLALATTRSAETPVPSERLAEEMTNRSADDYRLGRFYLIQHDYPTAIQLLRKAATGAGTPAEVHNDLGVGYFKRNETGDHELAEQAFKSAIAQDRDFQPAVFNLALLHESNGKTAEAEQQWKRYLELDPNSGWAQEVRARLLRKDFAK